MMSFDAKYIQTKNKVLTTLMQDIKVKICKNVAYKILQVRLPMIS